MGVCTQWSGKSGRRCWSSELCPPPRALLETFVVCINSLILEMKPYTLQMASWCKDVKNIGLVPFACVLNSCELSVYKWCEAMLSPKIMMSPLDYLAIVNSCQGWLYDTYDNMLGIIWFVRAGCSWCSNCLETLSLHFLILNFIRWWYHRDHIAFIVVRKIYTGNYDF